jgi:hypothetical protein
MKVTSLPATNEKLNRVILNDLRKVISNASFSWPRCTRKTLLTSEPGVTRE